MADPKPFRLLPIFVVPFFIVLGCLIPIFGFALLFHKEKSPMEYLRDVGISHQGTRWVSAYELALSIRGEQKLPEPLYMEILRMLKGEENALDVKTRNYLFKAAGEWKDKRLLPLIHEEIRTRGPSSLFALDSLRAFLQTSSRTEEEMIKDILKEAARSEDKAVRKLGAHLLAYTHFPEGTFFLRSLLKDPVNDVRWNAAISLSYRGEKGGENILLSLLNRTYVIKELKKNKENKVPKAEDVEEIMLGAIEAVLKAGLLKARPPLEKLSTTDPSLKVRSAALRILEKFS